MKKYLIVLSTLIISSNLVSQVTIKFHTTPTITNKGVFNKTEKISETITPALTEKDISKDSQGGTYKFAIPKPVDINLLSWGTGEVFDNNIIYRHKIIGLEALSISVTFDRMFLSENAELYIYNPTGTIITGPVTAKENISKDRVWSSNSFPGNAIILELRVPKNEQYQNDLHIFKLLIGKKEKLNLNPSDSLSFGNFNTSSSCNINILCSQGANWAAERNAICLITTEDGAYGSGSLVTNTCNQNRPYILTAWHITNGRNPNNWTYIFGWWSSTCTPNTYNQQALLFNGASLRATYQPSDFSLLELSQTPASNSGLTYLGWTRSSAIPASSVGIHHPSGDQMKISFANNPAVIGNIGTGTNNAWRVLWNQGIVQPGSSGSPLFDMVSHKVIGQLYSGTQPVGPPCNVQTGGTNYGRFDISWTGGGTKATRLKDWLDPGNSGAITTNTTNVSLLSPAFDASTLNINGPDLICNYSDYTVSNLPPGAVVTWSIPSSAGSVLQLSPNTPSANALRITNMRWYGVSTTLTATITNLPCGASQTRTKIVANDNNTTSTPLSPYYQEACLAGNVNHPSQSGSTSGATFVHQGCMVYVNLGDMIGRTITFTGATAPLTWGFGTTAYYQNTLYFILPLGSGGIPFSWKVSGTGACFESNYLFFSYSNNGRYAFAAMPNPAKDILTISAKENEDLLLQTKSKSANEELHFIMNIYDINTNILQITKSSNIGSLKHSINISKLKTGYYVLQIVEDDQSHTIKFFKE